MSRGTCYLPWSANTLAEVSEERGRQERKWGQQDHPDGTGPWLLLWGMPTTLAGHARARNIERWARDRCQRAPDEGGDTYERILTEKWAEAIAADDPEKLRTELLQVAAVAVAWIEAIDRRRPASDAGRR